ncbi:MAG: peptidoglycan bridge formation glycyltransferase FemA/FemB family protein [Ignavibacteriae bacterium]|nr:peptidoglycan bridge formation glycyltransferase FemA/FemB family protein [Ignavibacteriota bacterium]
MNHTKITYSILATNEKEWSSILSQFDDATIYHTNSFAKYSVGGKKADQFIVKNNNEIIAAALIRIKTIPLLERGIAYLRWGPIWRKKDEPINISNFIIALDLLYKEYVIKRKLVLRISSHCLVEDETDFTKVFLEAGFKKYEIIDKTIFVDLFQDEETLRKNFRGQWRNRLKKAEKGELTVIQGNNDSLFNEFLNIYKEMHNRKNFKEYVDVESFKEINSELEDKNKLQIFICKYDNKPLSGIVATSMGNSGIYLLGGSTSEGLKMSSSYLLQWETMMWMKSKSIRWYDLGGIDKENNPGVYFFKSGMGGKEKTFLGGFEAGKNKLSKIIIYIKELLSK